VAVLVMFIFIEMKVCLWLQDLTSVSANAIAFLSVDVALAVSEFFWLTVFYHASTCNAC